MSGAYDVARDAAAKLLRECHESTPENDLAYYEEEIEIIAEYLGVKEEQ